MYSCVGCNFIIGHEIKQSRRLVGTGKTMDNVDYTTCRLLGPTWREYP